MKYSLVIYNNNGIYEIKGYSNTNRFANINENSLMDIVSFTSDFVDKEDLQIFLQENGLLPSSYLDGDFGISYTKSGKTKILQYGITYYEDKKYFDINTLRDYYLSNLDTVNFMRLFIEKYYENLHTVPIFRDALNYLHYAYEFLLENGFVPRDTKGKMAWFITLYSKKKNRNNDEEIDYTKLRDLAMFVANYEKNHTRNKKLKFAPKLIQEEINHYAKMLESNDLTTEERDAYEKRIKMLLHELNFGNDDLGGRARKNASTKY